MPTETVTSWMERINELIEGYSLENICNMGESGCFFKALPDKGFVDKGKQTKGGKKSKQRLTVAFFVKAAGQKVDQPIVIWKSKLPRCFKKLQNPSHPANDHYFPNTKSWMKCEVMEAVLVHFNRKLVFEDGKVNLFLNNATYHTESMIGHFWQIKIIFLPKNTTSRYNNWMLASYKISRSSIQRDWLSSARKDPGGCICNINCQGCGCTCGYSMAIRSVE